MPKKWILCLILFLAGPAFGAQSAREIEAVNAAIIGRTRGMLGMQGGDRARIEGARLQIAPLLAVTDLKLAEHLMDFVESDANEFSRFIVLNSLWDIEPLEDTTAFDRLLAYFEDPKTSSSDRTSVSNSWRAAGIRSQNPALLAKVAARAQACKNYDALNDYLFFLDQERSALVANPWYLSLLYKNLKDHAVSLQVRATSARSLAMTISKFGTIPADSPTAATIRQNLMEALASEPNVDVQIEIIAAMTMAPSPAYLETLVRLKVSAPEEKIRQAADRALFAARGGFEASNSISTLQKIKNAGARVLGKFDRLGQACGGFLK
jgi:hypothetical protein